MEKINATLTATVYNEEKTIERFLESILSQTVLPKQVVITDGGSNDSTVAILNSQFSIFKKKGVSFIIKSKKGNRSVGRNEAVRLATSDLILITDAGCDLDKNWVKEIVKPFAKKDTDVVAGYYMGKAETVFEKCLVPYVLVMPDHVNPETFLPATRSMAIRKNVFERVRGFDETYAHNEDYVFAHVLKDSGAKIVFQKSAIVYWYPRSTGKEAYRMFWRFAYGDAESGILRRKVIFLFVRYILGIAVLLYFLVVNPSLLFAISYVLLATCYMAWAVAKNYRYAPDIRAIFVFPYLQVLSDIAVISGTMQGGVKKRWAIRKIS
jgi:glycosyltransferase involved in cell wall biosynthesis